MNLFLRTLISTMAFVATCGSAHALDLTRSVKVVEGQNTNLYLGNLYGQTLYTFDADTATESQCNAACAEKWPPLLIGADEAAQITAPYGTIKRATGLLQLTYKGKALYSFFLDHVEGDDKGDGVGGVWHDIDFE